MHQPLPHGWFGFDGAGEDIIGFARSLATQVENIKGVGDLPSYRSTRRLPDGSGHVSIVSSYGVRRVFFYPAEGKEREDVEDDEGGLQYVPMLFSASVERARLRPGEKPVLLLSETTRKRLKGYGLVQDKRVPKDVPKRVELERFDVRYSQTLGQLDEPQASATKHTQYAKLRASWYSSAAADVVQIVSGYGRQDFKELPPDPVERAVMLLPQAVMEQAMAQSVGMLPGYVGKPAKSGSVEMNYTFAYNDVVSFGADGFPWLVRIKSDGVFAMPLPLSPLTATQAFRKYVEKVDDDELLKIMDRFKGLPTGEVFPAGRQFQAWQDAGAIIKVCESSAFYAMHPMYAACGFSMNRNGTQGFNTAYKHRDDGLMEVASFSLSLRIGVVTDARCDDFGRAGRSTDGDAPPDAGAAAGVVRYVIDVMQAIREKHPDYEGAVRYKMARQGFSFLASQASGGSGGKGAEFWINLKLPPIAGASGSLKKTGQGPVYWPGRNQRSNGRLKFPEFSGKGCESFPLISPEYGGGSVRCDTVVAGFYAGDSLKVIKYFYDDRKGKPTSTDNFEECMIVGSWERVIKSGNVGLMGNFYTTDFDGREAIADTTVTTTIVGKDLGYGTPLYVSPALLMAAGGGVSRSRFYTHLTKTTVEYGNSAGMAACIPCFMRDALVYPSSKSSGGGEYHESLKRHAVDDPNSYALWTYDPIWHWIGQTPAGNVGEPEPKEGEYVYVDSHIYSPNPCNGFADSGNWLNLPPGGFLDVTPILGRFTKRGENMAAGGGSVGGEAPQVQEYATSKETGKRETSSKVSVSEVTCGDVKAEDLRDANPYHTFLPEDDYYLPCMGLTIKFGERKLLKLTTPTGDQKWGYSALYSDKTTNFIGVINE